jgi:nucleoside-diphosphate-sugar epimerase
MRALDGVYGVHSMQNWRASDIEGEIPQGMHLADASKRARISHLVLPFTIVRPVFFMENWLDMRQEIEKGALSLPLSSQTRLQMVAVDDIGGVVASALERPGKWQTRVFEIAGDELSMAQLAQVFTRLTGHEVRYSRVPWDAFESQAGKETAQMFRWFEETGFHIDIPSSETRVPEADCFRCLAQCQLARRHANGWIAATGGIFSSYFRMRNKLL